MPNAMKTFGPEIGAVAMVLVLILMRVLSHYGITVDPSIEDGLITATGYVIVALVKRWTAAPSIPAYVSPEVLKDAVKPETKT